MTNHYGDDVPANGEPNPRGGPVNTTPVKEDERLFIMHEGTRGTVKCRMNAWFPFEDRYWPFKEDKYNKNRSIVRGDNDVWVLLLRRDYDPDKGGFKHALEVRKGVLDDDIHPSRTRKYKGFMLVDPGSAMAALLISKDSEKPID